jgi:hypothetical protein
VGSIEPDRETAQKGAHDKDFSRKKVKNSRSNSNKSKKVEKANYLGAGVSLAERLSPEALRHDVLLQ